MVLNDNNKNDLWCKISLKVASHSHGGETFINFFFLIYKFSLSSNTTSYNDMKLILQENEMIEIRQV